MTHSKMPAILSFMLTFMVAGVIGYQLYKTGDIKESYMTGQLVTGWMMSLTYWYGTTRSSANKDQAAIDKNKQSEVKPEPSDDK